MGRCPLHHVVGVVHVPLAPALRYSSRVIQNPVRTPLNFKAARARLLSLCYILPPASAAFPCVHSFLVCWPPLFFSSSLADVALWLGPYMRISSHNDICTRTQKVQKCRQITTNQKPHKNNKTTRKFPSQICVSSKQTANQKHKGARAQTTTPTKRICQGTQRSYHCVTLKNMPKKLIIHHDIQ